MKFYSSHYHGFIRVAACTYPISLASPQANAKSIIEIANYCNEKNVSLVVFPELALSGYTVDDLLLQEVLLNSVEKSLIEIILESTSINTVLIVGAPIQNQHCIYNTAVVIHHGKILGVVPKSYLPNYREFYELRQMTSGRNLRETIWIAGFEVPFGTDLLFVATDLPNFIFHVEICEDMFVPISPSAQAALSGATILTNLSSSPTTSGRNEERILIARSISSRCLAAYVYSSTGEGESTNDLTWDGQTMIWENGTLLAESECFPNSRGKSIADIDLDLLCSERLRIGTFNDNACHHKNIIRPHRRIKFQLNLTLTDIGLMRSINRFPFLQSDSIYKKHHYSQMANIQVAGLKQRLSALKNPKLVLGISGGLDSTHALLVATYLMDELSRPRSDILAFTLPGFATSELTLGNAVHLSNELGVTLEEIDIKDAAELALKEIEHPFAYGKNVYDTTFENVQTGVRANYLFRIANQRKGIVIGTGNMSELALGWCTYGVGDHMSHYSINCGIPKTIIQQFIRWVIISGKFSERVNKRLQSILNTEITPELIPYKRKKESQSSEAEIGPYSLHDFSLFYSLRYGFCPSKIAFLAWHSWHNSTTGEWPITLPNNKRIAYSIKEIKYWLKVFVKYFYSSSQFKRSTSPNGPKVLHGGTLSPRGDWRAPSDISALIWLNEIEHNIPEH